jgi:CRP-like cAMP-binding protein
MAPHENRNYIWEFLSSFTQTSEERDALLFLRSSVFFKDLTARELKGVLSILHQRSYEEGEFLFQFDQPGACLFFIQAGEVIVNAPNKTGEMTIITTLLPGTFFGELALLDQSPRTASVKATKKTKTLALFRDDLHSLMSRDPNLACKIYHSLATIIGKRLVETTKAMTTLKQREASQ